MPSDTHLRVLEHLLRDPVFSHRAFERSTTQAAALERLRQAYGIRVATLLLAGLAGSLEVQVGIDAHPFMLDELVESGPWTFERRSDHVRVHHTHLQGYELDQEAFDIAFGFGVELLAHKTAGLRLALDRLFATG